MSDPYLYAIVLRLAALRRGAVPADHGDQARAALMHVLRQGDAAFTQKLHDENAHKPYTISLLQNNKRGTDGALHFGEGDAADWRFTLLCEPAYEALLRRYLLSRDLPQVRIGAIEFAIVDAFASGRSHPDSGAVSVAQLLERWNCLPESLPPDIVLDFRAPTAFSLGRNADTGEYRYQSLPDARVLFSALRKRWGGLSGSEPGDVFDAWVGEHVQMEPLSVRTRTVVIEHRPVVGFTGTVRFKTRGDIRWLSLLHLLADLAFWTGVGYQTTRGMGQVRRVSDERRP